MNEKLETLLNAGREKLAVMEAEKVEKESRLHALRTLQAINDAEKFLSLVPAELHEFLSHDHRYIYINLAGAAQVVAEYRATTERREHEGLSDLFIAEIWLKEDAVSGNVWSLWRNHAYEGDFGFVPCGKDEYYKDIDVALARAVELGDGKAEAEAEAAKQRAEFAEWDAPDDPVDERDEICPLMSTVQNRMPCLQHDCAWFQRGTCAVNLIVWNGDQQ